MLKAEKKVQPICKICCGIVKEGTGTQCQGACKIWLHYKCLNYSALKISEIKCGNIKIICPCPGCSAKGKSCGATSRNQDMVKPQGSTDDCANYTSSENDVRRGDAVLSQQSECGAGGAGAIAGARKCPSLATVELMCKKLEKLTVQINDIVAKMKENEQKCSPKLQRR